MKRSNFWQFHLYPCLRSVVLLVLLLLDNKLSSLGFKVLLSNTINARCVRKSSRRLFDLLRNTWASSRLFDNTRLWFSKSRPAISDAVKSVPTVPAGSVGTSATNNLCLYVRFFKSEETCCTLWYSSRHLSHRMVLTWWSWWFVNYMCVERVFIN
jgi:hypothetical protein